LANGGAMGALIHAQDRRATALGFPPNGHPPLKASWLPCSAVFSSWSWIGPGFFSFFNHSYRRMLGLRFGGLSGRPAAKHWAESWAEIEPITNKALGGQGAVTTPDGPESLHGPC